MTSVEVLIEAYGRLPELVRDAVEGLDADQLSVRPAGTANSVAWLIWHLSRVEDNHFAEAFDQDELWTASGHAERWQLPLDVGDTGYGHSSEQVDAVRVESAQQLLEYFDAVHERARDLLAGLDDDELERVVDEDWDPPVTLLARLVSVIDDAVQHAGQAGYARGMVLGAD